MSSNVVAIDLGGTKLSGAIVDRKGNILKEKKVETKASLGKKTLIKNLTELIKDLIKDENISAIGIASAGRINTDEGSVFFATDNLPNWTGTNIRDILNKEFNLPVYVENDVNAAGYGEQWLGASKDKKSSLCITLGTGVAGAVIIDEKIVRGEHWSAGEIGHMVLHPNGNQCNCGLKGCFEQYCSGTALVKNYNKAYSKNLKSGYDFFELIEKEDKKAFKVLDEFTDDLSLAIVNLANTFDPEVFVVGGGLINTANYWWDSLLRKIQTSPLTEIFTPNIKKAKLKNKAGIYGIAKLTFEYLEELN